MSEEGSEDGRREGWRDRAEKEERRKVKKEQKKETCDVGGMAVVSAGIGKIGITGIMGEEGGAASAC